MNKTDNSVTECCWMYAFNLSHTTWPIGCGIPCLCGRTIDGLGYHKNWNGHNHPHHQCCRCPHCTLQYLPFFGNAVIIAYLKNITQVLNWFSKSLLRTIIVWCSLSVTVLHSVEHFHIISFSFFWISSNVSKKSTSIFSCLGFELLHTILCVEQQKFLLFHSKTALMKQYGTHVTACYVQLLYSSHKS